MNQKLIEILEHEVNAGLTIVTTDGQSPHIANTWNHYVHVHEEKLLIPAGGLVRTEKNVKTNSVVKLSISNPLVQGFQYPGTGLVLQGQASFETAGPAFDLMKKKFPWIRAVMVVEVVEAKQTQ